MPNAFSQTSPATRGLENRQWWLAAGLAGLVLAQVTCSDSTPTPQASPSAPAATVADWPMYGHDNAHTSVNAGDTTLSPTNIGALAPLWQKELGTSGDPPSASPTVADGRVFAGSSVRDGDNLLAFDAATGQELWSADLDRRAGPCGGFSEIGIPSTPAVSGSTVVVGGGNAAYFALDAASGRVLWKHDISDAGPSAYAWESPLIRGNLVYVGIAAQCDNPSVRGELRALSVADGSLRARRYFTRGARGAGIWNSPALSADGNTLFVTTGEDDQHDEGPYEQAVVALDPVTLDIRQAYRVGPSGRDQDFGSSPILFHDAAQRSLVGAGNKDGCFYAFDATNLAAGPVWRRCIKPDVGMMAAYDATAGPGGLLLVPTNDDSPQLHFLDPASGDDRQAPTKTAFPHGHVTVAGGLVFLNAGPTGVQVLDETSGAQLRTLAASDLGRAFSGPVVAGGRLYFLSGSKLNAWALP